MIFKKLIKRKFFREKLSQLRGSKKLIKKNDPNFVFNIMSNLSEIQLGLEDHDFPKILVLSHSDDAKIMLRQSFLYRINEICSKIMQSIGNGKALATALPPNWVNFLTSKGINCSNIHCNILLYLTALKKILAGVKKFIFLGSQIKIPKNLNCSYVAFLNLDIGNFPNSPNNQSRDLITWYKNSCIKRPNIKKILIHTRHEKNSHPSHDLIISKSFLPRFSSFFNWLQFCSVTILAIFVAIIGILRGKWWYGFLLDESILLHYVNKSKSEDLAEEYFITNSDWFHKPMWAYEAEKKLHLVNLIFYSTNNEHFMYNDYKFNIFPGYKTLSWKRFIVWDKYQEDFLKQFCPYSEYIKVGYVDIKGSSIINISKEDMKILSIFDVTAFRPISYTSLGFTIPYYTEELNIQFLKDIKEIFKDNNWKILWKRKRVLKKSHCSSSYIKKILELENENFVCIDPEIAASTMVEYSNAVISMPFSSPSIIAKHKDIPCAFYDSSGNVKLNRDRGIPLLKDKRELKKWAKSLT